MITLVDYGLGNIQAFLNVYKRHNIAARTASTVAELQGSDRLILPGVGSFDHAMERLDASGMRLALDELVLERKVPVLGVCVGMQMLGDSSEEGKRAGLGWIPGAVRRFSSAAGTSPLPVPHMGWNDVLPEPGSRLFAQLESDARFYFLHSYYFECERPADIAARAVYGSSFCCAASSGNIHGVQFHPEKSHGWGSRLLKNFAEL